MDESGCGRKPKQEKETKMKHDELNGTLSIPVHTRTLGFQCVDALAVLCAVLLLETFRAGEI